VGYHRNVKLRQRIGPIGLIVLLPLLLGAGARPLAGPLAAPRIVVNKSLRSLQLFSREKLVRLYRIALGTSPVGRKEHAGDRRTPEGTYTICNKNPHSQFYLSLQISYPGPADADRALASRLINAEQHRRILEASRRGGQPPPNTALGGEIFIHGGNSRGDWTWGCIALDNRDIKELFELVPVGTPVEILP